MATELSPLQACEATDSAYELRRSSEMRDVAELAPNLRGAFDIMGGTRLTGTTGLGATKTMGFGYLAWGKAAREGECIIGIRGTFPTSVYDWLTNLRIAGTRGPGGYIVHEGFWKGAASILPQVEAALRRRNPSAIHIVGHSLGGAMATLMADVLAGYGAETKLYTFGAPRSGVEGHARYLSTKLKPTNIFRAWHDNDPVPMVPIFPYAHLPFDSNAYGMKGPGGLVSVQAHVMPSYKRSVGTASWASLPLVALPFSSFDAASSWLADAAKGSSPGITMSATALRMILAALHWIIDAVGKAFGLTVFAGATLLDGLARLLYAGALQSWKAAKTVEHLMAAALRFTGRVVEAGMKLSVAFIQYVLELLFRIIAAPIAGAIARLS
jgi:triacylglycerol lipase